MRKKLLPTGIQHFETLRSEDCYYVDKTPLIRQLIYQGRYYFLSRPRRFGKSLLVSTIAALFEGQESLFKGLEIHEHWNWSITHPVVRLSFGGGDYNQSGGLAQNIATTLTLIEEDFGIEPPATPCSGPDRLRFLIRRLYRKTGQQVVMLVDEYDKPILDVIHNKELATANRDDLRNFYGVIKDSAEHVRFVFVTGVSMFSKVSLFSELNHLTDISLNPEYATICGYTDNDLDTVFAPELENLNRNKIRRWYNGYHWRGKEKLYNPFDILLLFRNRDFDTYWFQTGSPRY